MLYEIWLDFANYQSISALAFLQVLLTLAILRSSRERYKAIGARQTCYTARTLPSRGICFQTCTARANMHAMELWTRVKGHIVHDLHMKEA